MEFGVGVFMVCLLIWFVGFMTDVKLKKIFIVLTGIRDELKKMNEKVRR